MPVRPVKTALDRPFSCHQGLLIVVLAVLLAAIALAGSPAPASAAPNRLSARRILSLGPALTEMCFALGLGDRVVGRTDFCNYPPAAKRLPSVGALTGWNEEIVIGLRPDAILAVEGERGPVERLAKLTGAKLQVLSTRHVADVWTNMGTIGQLAGVGAAANKTVVRLKAAYEARSSRAIATTKRPRVFYMLWDQPLMTAGPDSYLGDLITAAGGQNIVPAHIPAAYPPFSWEALLAANPDVVLAPVDRKAALTSLATRFPNLAAVKARRLHALPDDLISRPGPRVVEALDAVVTALSAPARE